MAGATGSSSDHPLNPSPIARFAFLPHNIMPRRAPPRVAETPPPPPPLQSQPAATVDTSLPLTVTVSSKIRVPIPKNLPPGPLEIPVIDYERGCPPPPVTESRSSRRRKLEALRQYGRRNGGANGCGAGGLTGRGSRFNNYQGFNHFRRNATNGMQYRRRDVNPTKKNDFVAKEKVKKEWVVVSRKKEEKNVDGKVSEVGSSDSSRSQETESTGERINDQFSNTETDDDYVPELTDDRSCSGEEFDYKGEVRYSDSEQGGSGREKDVALNGIKTLALEDDADVNKQSNLSRSRRARSDSRGQRVSDYAFRRFQRHIKCRPDIETLTLGFLSVYESLVPAETETVKQKQVIHSLENQVRKEWPDAKLHLYGSSASSFGFRSSDIDVCIFIGDSISSKHDVVLKLANVLRLDNNLHDVEPITNARVPIVKVKDLKTGISCDICVNNLFALANTKLLRDYAQIDDRLHQLAFIVKHWAKSRGVNEAYQGTLSSYAYVLLCINFLQMQEPPILPCLQRMESTFVWTIDDTKCTYYDQIEELKGFGEQNKESIGLLIWKFFQYWAYHHDYHNDVISVRNGCIISKQVKSWTTRVGFDRHLLCIEDPFETSHDLGRRVDKYSIRILQEEFERAADILQYEDDPCSSLFEPYVPESMQSLDFDYMDD